MHPVLANQVRTFWKLYDVLRPHVATDRSFPDRLRKTLAAEKRFGSRDRRFYRELLYTAIRYLPWIDAVRSRSEDEACLALAWLTDDAPATAALRAEVPPTWGGLPKDLAAMAAKLGVDASAVFPDWFAAECPGAMSPENHYTLQKRASLWLRIPARHVTAVTEEFGMRNWRLSPHASQPDAFEVSNEVDVTQTRAYENGWFEIQDVGSQAILASIRVPAGERWLDACAGAGGKTLQLAETLVNGTIDAWDSRPDALGELSLRAQRARLRNVRLLRQPPGREPVYDAILVDAPCSGSGTWRRSPHLKWHTTPALILESARLQREILEQNAPRVRPGGRLIYATCSLCRRENEEQVETFLGAHPEFRPGSLVTTSTAAGSHHRALLPADLGGDGFFVAEMVRS